MSLRPLHPSPIDMSDIESTVGALQGSDPDLLADRRVAWLERYSAHFVSVVTVVTTFIMVVANIDGSLRIMSVEFER